MSLLDGNDDVVEIEGRKFRMSDLNITDVNLSKTLQTQPGDYAFIGILAARAKRNVENLSNDLKIVEATVDQEIRKGIEASGAKKPTEDTIRANILTDARRKEASAKLEGARDNEAVLSALLYAYGQRKDCAVALAALRRSEMSNVNPTSV